MLYMKLDVLVGDHHTYVPCQERELSCICVFMVSILFLYLQFLDWILNLFQQCHFFLSILYHQYFRDRKFTEEIRASRKSKKPYNHK